ncbi:MAG: YraN family protein [Candidatus Omnitrophota bacterium]
MKNRPLSRKHLGKLAEDIAVKYVRRDGLKIIDRNFTCRFGEIDVIAVDLDEIVFIEVRSLRGSFFTDPAGSINFLKIKKLRKSAFVWYSLSKIVETNFRFDVIAIVFSKTDGKVERIEHIRDAF